MACERFEQEGLLFVSNELEPAPRREYEAHVEACKDCRAEIESYGAIQAATGYGKFLEADTSARIDASILSRCAKPVHATSFAFFSSPLVRKFALPAFFLAFGFAGGAYFAGMFSTSSTVSSSSKTPVVQQTQVATNVVEKPNAQKPKDTATEKRHLGNLGGEGVVRVNLNNDQK